MELSALINLYLTLVHLPWPHGVCWLMMKANSWLTLNFSSTDKTPQSQSSQLKRGFQLVALNMCQQSHTTSPPLPSREPLWAQSQPCPSHFRTCTSSTTCPTTSPRWRSTWSTEGPRLSSFTGRGPLEPSRLTTLSSRSITSWQVCRDLPYGFALKNKWWKFKWLTIIIEAKFDFCHEPVFSSSFPHFDGAPKSRARWLYSQVWICC